MKEGSSDDESVAVMFPGNRTLINCSLDQLSRAPPPPLPDGYAVGEKVYFTHDSQTVTTGGKLTHGQAGERDGAPGERQPLLRSLHVREVPGEQAQRLLLLDQLTTYRRRRCRAEAAVGEKVYYIEDSQTIPSGNKLTQRTSVDSRWWGTRRATTPPSSARAWP